MPTQNMLPSNYKQLQRVFREQPTDLSLPSFSRMVSRDIIPYLERHYYSQRSWYVFTMGEAWFNRQVERFLFHYQSQDHPWAHRAHYMPAVERIGLEMEQFPHHVQVE
jgi:hypothetical protein